MRTLVDENMSSPRLATVLRGAGFDVAFASRPATRSQSDARVMIEAINQGSLVLTRDYEDFTDLHDLILTSGGRHPGILVVRFDDDPTRKMSLRAICTAISNLQSAGVPIENQLHVLNHWRRP